MRKTTKLFTLLLLATTALAHAKSLDYNGTPITNSRAKIVITPQTSSALLASYTQSINTAGLLDNTFGTLGIVTGPTGTAFSTLLQPDGKIIVLGSTTFGIGNFLLVRYNTNGTVDTSFNGGTVTRPTGVIYTSFLQPDGKIVALGSSGTNTLLTRYLSNGIGDPTFNSGTPITGPTGFILASLLQPDGKIIAIGTSAGHMLLMRYTSQGIIDTSFNGGTVTGPTGNAYAALLQPDGKIVAIGDDAGANFLLARYNSDGTPDTSFNGGTVLGPIGTAYAALLQPDGKIVALGTDNGGGPANSILIRYNSNGTVDTSFSGETGITGPAGVFYAALLQPDNKIIGLGCTNITGGTIMLTRYNSNGTVDSSFGPQGSNVVTTPHTDFIFSAQLQPDGKIIGAGNDTGGVHMCLVRYINPFTLASFTASYGEVGIL